MYGDRCDSTSGQKCHGIRRRTETKEQDVVYRDAGNVEYGSSSVYKIQAFISWRYLLVR